MNLQEMKPDEVEKIIADFATRHVGLSLDKSDKLDQAMGLICALIIELHFIKNKPKSNIIKPGDIN